MEICNSWEFCVVRLVMLQSGRKRVLLLLNKFHTYIISFYLNAVNPPPPTPTPESMLFVVKERLVGLKHNGFGGRGWGYTRVGDWYVHCPKRGHFIEVSQHFCPSFYLWIYFENNESGAHPVIHLKPLLPVIHLKAITARR